MMRGCSLITRVSLAVVVFALFVWLSPQVYYTYYRMILDGLPAQWVIGWPPFWEMIENASFTGPRNMSAHGKGMLFLALISVALMGEADRGPKP